MADVINIGLFGLGGGGVRIEYSTILKPSSLLSGVLMYFENVPERFSKPCLCYTGPRCHVKCVLKSQVLNLFFSESPEFFLKPWLCSVDGDGMTRKLAVAHTIFL